MNTGILVRDIATGEMPVLAYLYGDSFEEAYPEPVAASLLRTPGAWCQLAIATETSLPLGFVIARTILDEAEILTIGTLAQARRQGAATALLEATFTRAGSAGARVVHLEVGEDNPAAIALYRKLGFRRTGRRPDYYRRADRRRIAAILMSRDISTEE